MNKKLLLISACALSFNAWALDTGFSPTSLKLTIYKFAVSTSPYCTNLITVVDNGNTGVETDFVNHPNLGSGVLADGTYPCVVIEVSDNVKFTPNGTSTSGLCVSGAESVIDICRTDQGGGGGVAASTLVDGTVVNCTGTDVPIAPIANRVALYLSTASTAGNDTFHPPSLGDTAHGLTLGSALVVSGTSVGQFRMNATNQVMDSSIASAPNGKCEMQAPAFSFSKI